MNSEEVFLQGFALRFLFLGNIISLRGDSDERKSVDDKIKSVCA